MTDVAIKILKILIRVESKFVVDKHWLIGNITGNNLS